MGVVRRHSYRHVRHAYQALANRGYARKRNELAALLRNFVKRGDLVFDVGANRGDYTDVLLAIGAKVVSVEPNLVFANRIRACYPVVVEQAAVGAAPGKSQMHLGIDPGHSTLSNHWVDRAPTKDRWSGRTVMVEVVTLADLAARFGQPAFVKIDVEGYEAEVLRGCDQFPPALSFEYQCSALSVTDECLALLDGYEFNHVPSNAAGFVDDWCSASELRTRLGAYNPAAYGDVYAGRETGPSPRRVTDRRPLDTPH
jgi:FkbM family methyltransferase